MDAWSLRSSQQPSVPGPPQTKHSSVSPLRWHGQVAGPGKPYLGHDWSLICFPARSWAGLGWAGLGWAGLGWLGWAGSKMVTFIISSPRPPDTRPAAWSRHSRGSGHWEIEAGSELNSIIIKLCVDMLYNNWDKYKMFILPKLRPNTGTRAHAQLWLFVKLVCDVGAIKSSLFVSMKTDENTMCVFWAVLATYYDSEGAGGPRRGCEKQDSSSSQNM